MARYNREFLVPYLQNVCALHLAKNKIDDQYATLYIREKRLQDELKKTLQKPDPPERADYSLVLPCAMLGAGSFLVGMLFAVIGVSLFGVFFFLGGGMFMMIALFSAGSAHNKKEEDIGRYETAMEKYNIKLSEVQKANNYIKEYKLPAVQQKLQESIREKKKAEQLLNQIYSVNIIPGRYRDIYVAIYLYDWFSTSQADDLDMALSMFVLEEIKDKLDKIIENQAEIILNQRIMMANQQKSLEQQQYHSQIMHSKLNRIAASNEERNIYLSMIGSNTAATAYFAAADYIRNI